jgi:hypothetical protein
MTKVVVYHSPYGYETGCCGHVVELTEEEVKCPICDGRKKILVPSGVGEGKPIVREAACMTCKGKGIIKPPQVEERFVFEENWEDEPETAREFAERLVEEKFGKEHVADLDWENCVISNGENC